MKNNWSREELVVAFNLYCKTPFTKINSRNRLVQDVASVLNRTPGALAMKLANFARLDPDLRDRGIRGLSGGSKGEEEIWNEFVANWEELSYESERALEMLKGTVPHFVDDGEEILKLRDGEERVVIAKERVNQSFFRTTVLASYNGKCCVTGVKSPQLLVAGHIIPWSIDKQNRVNPRNGICLNALHDRAFDKGLITVMPDFRLRVSTELLKIENDDVVASMFQRYDGKVITLPQKFLPSREFLEYHNENIFIG